MSHWRFAQVLVSPRLGGGEKLALDIYRHLNERWPGAGGVIVPQGGDTERVARAEGLPLLTYRFEQVTGAARVPSLLANLDLRRKLSRLSGGIVHIHSPFVYGALRTCLSLGKFRSILHLHLDYSAEQLRWPLTRAPDVVIGCAKFMQRRVTEVLAEHGHTHTRVTAAVNAVDLERFKPGDRASARQQLGLATPGPVYVMCANLAPHKGQETAIRAVAQLAARGLKPTLLLVGEERESQGFTAKLHSLVASLGVADLVQFLGFRKDVPLLLQAADCLLLPSTQEGLPLSILEAQASRVVVLAAPTAGIPEVIEDGRTGFLIGADDAAGYAARLETLSSNPALPEQIANEAYRQVTSGFGMRQYAQRICDEYERLAGGPALNLGSAA
jgi:glycosyltransferase involved in cell wall biosynthesis